MKKTLFITTFLLLLVNLSLCQCYTNNALSSFKKSKTSGNVLLDDILNTEYSLLQEVFGVNIDLYILDDSEGANAYFSPLCEHSKCNGSVLIGYQLMANELNATNGAETIKAIMAHEFGHALQHLYGWAGIGWQKEIHADFMAGYYIGLKSYLYEQNIELFAAGFYEKGDYDFYSKYHHGTPEERACAFCEGYLIAVKYGYNTYQAYLAGLDYVSNNEPCASFQVSESYAKSPKKKEVPSKGNLIFKTDKRLLTLWNNKQQLIGYVINFQPFVAEDVDAGTYVITPFADKRIGADYRLPPISVTVKPNSTTIVSITNVKTFWQISYDYTIQYESFPEPKNYYKEAYDLYAAGSFKKAKDLFTQEIESNPNNFNAYFFRAICFSNIGDYDLAISDYKTILKNESNITNPIFLIGTVYNNIAYAYIQDGDFNTAKEYLNIAITIAPNESYIWGTHGELAYKEGDFDLCIDDMTKCIKLVEEDKSKAKGLAGQGFAYYYRGLAYIAIDKNEDGCADLKHAKSLNYQPAIDSLINNCE